MSIVNIFLGSFDPPRGSHLGFVHTFLVIFSGVNYFFTAHAYFKPKLLMIPYAFRILQQYYIKFH